MIKKDEELKMEHITNDDLVCKDCRYKFNDKEMVSDTLKCYKFKFRKPKDILDGKYCLQYEKCPRSQNKAK